MLIIYNSDYLENRNNCNYPHEIQIKDAASLDPKIFSKDYVPVLYKGNYRSNDNFKGTNCLALDCDNDHSDNPSEWKTPQDVINAFEGVFIVVHYSRNNMKAKGDKAPRPRFHVLMLIDYCTSAKEYCDLKKKVNSMFPYFDKQALDAARFFFGTSDPQVECSNGKMTLNEFLDEEDFEACFDKTIHEGSRNSTMSRFAARILKKYGDTLQAKDAFYEKAETCSPPLEEAELETIWHSALKFYNEKVLTSENYKKPEDYNDENSYKPLDYSDVGQAEVLAKYFSTELRYSKGTDFIKYRGNRWVESEPGAQATAQELTRRQLKESKELLSKAYNKLLNTGALAIMAGASKAKAESAMSEEQRKAFKEYQDAQAYEAFALKRRDSRYISSALKESHPLIEIETEQLDADPFLLNTPGGTFDLRKGILGLREHKSDDFITKITSVSASNKGKKIWLDTLDLIFGKDQELIEYVQTVCGLAAIGKVFVEALIIAYGDGGNGKSTFFNSIAKVLGSYYGGISADALTVGVRRNIQPEMAEARGKRLLIAAESQEGARLDESTIKQMCSTDNIQACKKYRDPFAFKPSHTLVLYTNHLPRVSANDEGTWRRLKVIPFKNKLTGPKDIKNYGDFLVENAGEYILTWIIEGAKKAIDLKYNIPEPDCVKAAIEVYREQNNWFNHFLEDRCDVSDKKAEISSGELYQQYRVYASQSGEFIRSTTDFYAALEKAGFIRVNRHNKRYFKGIKLLVDEGDFDDLLT